MLETWKNKVFKYVIKRSTTPKEWWWTHCERVTDKDVKYK